MSGRNWKEHNSRFKRNGTTCCGSLEEGSLICMLCRDNKEIPALEFTFFDKWHEAKCDKKEGKAFDSVYF